MQTEKSSEQLQSTQTVNPRVLELISSLSEAPDSLRLTVDDIGGEQCVVAQIVDLTQEVKNAFEGQPESDDDNLKRDWNLLRHDIENLGGVGDTEVQAVRSGETGRQKEIQVALFGIHNATELMENIFGLNELRKADGVEAQEGLPENLAYLPDNLLVATKQLREDSAEELRAVVSARNAAVESGVIAVGAVASKLPPK